MRHPISRLSITFKFIKIRCSFDTINIGQKAFYIIKLRNGGIIKLEYTWPEIRYKVINDFLPANLIKFDFVRTLFNLNWGIVYHGVLYHYIDYDFVKDFVKYQIEENISINPIVSELEKGMNIALLRILATTCENDGLVYEDFWLTIIAAWVFKNKETIEILLPRLNEIPLEKHPLRYIYFVLDTLNDDFGYKKKTECLTSYMAAASGNGKSIIGSLEDFVRKEVKRLNKLIELIQNIE